MINSGIVAPNASSLVPRDILAYGLMTPQNQQNYMQNRATTGNWIGGSQQATQNYLNQGLQQYAGQIQKQPYGSAVTNPAGLVNQMKGQQGTAMTRSGANRPGAAGGTPGTTQYGTAQQSAYSPAAASPGGTGMTPGAGGFYPQIQTGISVGPVLTPNIVQGEQQRMQNFRPQGVPSPFMGHLNDLIGQGTNNMATDFGRQAAYANAQQQLGTEQARANAGLGWGNVMLGNYASQLGTQQQALQALLSLLGNFGA